MADVQPIGITNLLDVPAMMRKVADDIERGDYGAIESAVFILPPRAPGDWPHVFGWGKETQEQTVYLLELAKLYLLSLVTVRQ